MGKNIAIAILSILLVMFIVRDNVTYSEMQQLEAEVALLNERSHSESYWEGYRNGEDDGYSNGKETGYDNGYTDGVTDGKEEGYYDGLAAGAELFCNYLRNETGVFYPLEERILSLQWYSDGEAPLSEAEEAFRELTDFCLKYDWAENCCSMGDVDFLYPDDQ